MGKTALIVDDSRSARVVLKKILEMHDLAVDTAESAEDALDYLSEFRPDVIFMDHLMPGMDGFEAVSAIKNNPDTATIPIMMYTSQEGEVYVGQARALGAVGVLPKQVEPVEVSKVLRSLRVIQSDDEDEAVPSAADISGQFAKLESLDHDIRLLIQDLFEQQRAVLRDELQSSSRTIASRVAEQIRPAEKTLADEQVADNNYLSRIMQAGIGGLSVVCIVLGVLYWQSAREAAQMRDLSTSLQAALDAATAANSLPAPEVQSRIDALQEANRALYLNNASGLEWGANLAAGYAFGELPLGDSRQALLEDLESQLNQVDFSGVVRIESHVGNHCMTFNAADGYQLAPADLPAGNCDSIGWDPGVAYETGLQQSVGFANFIRLADARSGGRIQYEIISLGNSDPVLGYPPTPVGITAAEWNRIAAANNRVEIAVLPDVR